MHITSTSTRARPEIFARSPSERRLCGVQLWYLCSIVFWQAVAAECVCIRANGWASAQSECFTALPCVATRHGRGWRWYTIAALGQRKLPGPAREQANAGARGHSQASGRCWLLERARGQRDRVSTARRRPQRQQHDLHSYSGTTLRVTRRGRLPTFAELKGGRHDH